MYRGGLYYIDAGARLDPKSSMLGVRGDTLHWICVFTSLRPRNAGSQEGACLVPRFYVVPFLYTVLIRRCFVFFRRSSDFLYFGAGLGFITVGHTRLVHGGWNGKCVLRLRR